MKSLRHVDGLFIQFILINYTIILYNVGRVQEIGIAAASGCFLCAEIPMARVGLSPLLAPISRLPHFYHSTLSFGFDSAATSRACLQWVTSLLRWQTNHNGLSYDAVGTRQSMEFNISNSGMLKVEWTICTQQSIVFCSDPAIYIEGN